MHATPKPGFGHHSRISQSGPEAVSKHPPSQTMSKALSNGRHGRCTEAPGSKVHSRNRLHQRFHLLNNIVELLELVGKEVISIVRRVQVPLLVREGNSLSLVPEHFVVLLPRVTLQEKEHLVVVHLGLCNVETALVKRSPLQV